MPVTKNCDILKEYCRFIEIVEQTYNRRFPKSSFRKAIEKSVSEGTLADYLERKSREVINMLCAKYDYKMDIAVKQEEAFADGKEAGLAIGARQNALETARKMLAKQIPLETVLECTGLTEEDLKEAAALAD